METGSDMEWPTSEDCYTAMSALVEYYMEGEQQGYWRSLISNGIESGRFPPGKGFLFDLDQVIGASGKPPMPNQAELYQLICTVCI